MNLHPKAAKPPSSSPLDLDLGDVQDYIETAMGGHTASEFWDGEKRFDVTVRLPTATREDIGAIRKIMLPLKNGTLLPLSAIADVSMATGRAATREVAQPRRESCPSHQVEPGLSPCYASGSISQTRSTE